MQFLMKLLFLSIFLILNCRVDNSERDSDFKSLLGITFKRLQEAEVSGIAIKGAVSGARVRILQPVNNACDNTITSSPLAEGTTDSDGNYTLRYPRTGSPVCVLVTPATNGKTMMYDETQKNQIAWNSSSYYLSSIIKDPGGLTSKGVVTSPFSRMASKVFAKTMEKAGKDFSNSIAESSSRQVVSMFGLNKGFIKSGKSLSETKDKNFRKDQFQRSLRSVPTLQEIKYDFSNPDDPFTAKFLVVSSGISALANKVAEANAKSLTKLQRETATGDAIETVINGFAEVVTSGGKKTTILRSVMQKANGGKVPPNFAANPLEATVQQGIKSYLTESGGAAEFGISASEVSGYFEMSSTPPTSLLIDIGTSPDYVYYADNNDSGALLFYKGQYDFAYPYIEGGLPNRFEITSGTLPDGLVLDPDYGVISGVPSSSVTSASLQIKASNSNGSYLSSFKIKVIDPNVITPLVLFSECTVNISCSVDIGVEGITDYNYTITNVTGLPSGLSFDSTFNSISGTPTEAKQVTINFDVLNLNTNKETKGLSVTFLINSSLDAEFIALDYGALYIMADESLTENNFSYLAYDFTQVSGITTLSPINPPSGLTYSLISDYSGITIDSDTGTLNFSNISSGLNQYHVLEITATSSSITAVTSIPVMIYGINRTFPSVSYSNFYNTINCNTGVNCTISPVYTSGASSFQYSEVDVSNLPELFYYISSIQGITLVNLSDLGLSVDPNTGIISGTILPGFSGTNTYSGVISYSTEFVGETYMPISIELTIDYSPPTLTYSTSPGASSIGPPPPLCYTESSCYWYPSSKGFGSGLTFSTSDSSFSSNGFNINASTGEVYTLSNPNSGTYLFQIDATSDGNTYSFPIEFVISPSLP